MSGGRLATEPSWTLLGKVEGDHQSNSSTTLYSPHARKCPLLSGFLFSFTGKPIGEEVNPMVAGSCPQDTQRKRFTGK